MRLSLSALEPAPEPEPVPVREERDNGRPEGRPERSERGERRERKGKGGRSRSFRDSSGYEDDGEALEYNPFAEAFKSLTEI